MKNTRQNIVVLRDIPEYANDISSKAVNMYMNRFCIDEDDAFELSGVFNLRKTEKEDHNREMIDLALQRSAETKADTEAIHLICNSSRGYSGQYFKYNLVQDSPLLSTCILNSMKKYQINTVMLTWIHLRKEELVLTSTDLISGYLVEKDLTESINDELEVFLEKLRLGHMYQDYAETYFMQQFSKKELEQKKPKNISKSLPFSGALKMCFISYCRGHPCFENAD